MRDYIEKGGPTVDEVIDLLSAKHQRRQRAAALRTRCEWGGAGRGQARRLGPLLGLQCWITWVACCKWR